MTANQPANKPCVIDIYYGDQVQDFAQTRAFGIVGVIHKASEATGFTDRLYAARRKLATDLGLKWGAYHFFHGAEPVAEADHFLDVAEPDAATLLALDWEDVPHQGAPSAAKARAFLERIEDRLGRKAVIYSGNVAKEEIDGADAYFGSHRLWLCQYGPSWRVQPSWQRPWLWQNNGDNYGPGPHTIPGIKGLCDNNTIIDPMTVDQLLAEWAA
jgi:GH25 family lysozyme M1 (1,4-beta-N-acetylmuramidase)